MADDLRELHDEAAAAILKQIAVKAKQEPGGSALGNLADAYAQLGTYQPRSRAVGVV